MSISSRGARAGEHGFAHSGAACSSPADLSEEGGAVFEVPFEAFFGAAVEASPNVSADPLFEAAQSRKRYRTSIAESDESAIPKADRYERSSATRAARESAHEKSSAAKQCPERSLKGRALGYLSRREYSRAELSRKLMPYTEDADALEALLDSLEREGWLSDVRFAESVVHRRAARVGSGRIVSELKRHAVGDALIEELSTQLRETELVRARAVWQKKYGQLPETPAERARQARFLAARGFSMSIIGKILKGFEEGCSDS
ncbi:recombination regulator RecX [Paraburkholderia lycopersici]|uniref:Regulatory protein RecX n=1 Tax=Paraburkholderia lycopersici TaxID=416944 RepID=A0A1G6KK86_9BURK|nr:recombination regulator RecX [Paraburkholderia lycopersici]SDC31384.1 regulatory protein [Paraburkholderia lycopersici]